MCFIFFSFFLGLDGLKVKSFEKLWATLTAGHTKYNQKVNKKKLGENWHIPPTELKKKKKILRM